MLLTIIFSKIFALLQAVQADSLAQLIQENAEEFEEVDPVGFGLAAVGIAVVFSSLLILYMVFLYISKFLQARGKKKLIQKGQLEDSKKESEMTGEINAAIAAALYFYSMELHDQESTVLTINRVSRIYSPWSSKIYGLRQYPR